jgi:hypothetical protein
MSEPTKQSMPESQKERWVKYGANVALVSIVAILLAGLVTYLAQRTNRRIDTTSSGAYSLKPQTVNLIRDLKGKTKLVSLYQKPTPEEQAADKMDFSQPVVDLLDEYRRKGKNIEVDSIDPVANPSKVDDLITEVTNKYGGEVAKYKKVLDATPETYKKLREAATAEVTQTSKLPLDKLGEDDDSQTTYAALSTISGLPRGIQQSEESIKRLTNQKPPDYKGAVDSVNELMDRWSQRAGKIAEIFDKSKSDAKLPPPIRDYMAQASPRYQAIKKLCDDLLKQTKDVGELKLDELRQSLRARDAILVMGEKDMRVLPREQVWQVDTASLRQLAPGQEIKPRFAGEQQITTAILALSQEKKAKVCFVRSGGPPMTTPGMMPFQRGGPMSYVGERMRQYNFDVLEKDLSGTWAMQSQMQRQPAPPEPSDEQIKDAIWIVLDFQGQQENPMMGPTPNMGPKVAEHLKSGGSAMILYNLKVEDMADALKDWGIEVHTDAVACHPPIKVSADARQQDMLEDAQKYPFVFDIRDYGDHLITRPLKSLPSMMLPLMVVKPAQQAVPGVKVTPIIPLPTDPASWGEKDVDALQSDPEKVKYDKASGDIEGPIFGGAVAEKEKGGRLVVVASPFPLDHWTDPYQSPDPKLLRSNILVSRFPGNLELFQNSVFWLAHMEPMIAISPAAMEVARIEPMGDAAKAIWRTGFVLIAIPALVILAGALVYVARRD